MAFSGGGDWRPTKYGHCSGCQPKGGGTVGKTWCAAERALAVSAFLNLYDVNDFEECVFLAHKVGSALGEIIPTRPCGVLKATVGHSINSDV